MHNVPFELVLHQCCKTSHPFMLSILLYLDVIGTLLFNKAGTKVGPDQLGPPVRVGSTRIDLDQLGSKEKIKIE